jgi:hypothetical protein
MVASAAVGGLFLAVTWTMKAARGSVPADQAAAQVKSGLKWFNYATMIQILIGFWFLLALPAISCCCSWAAARSTPRSFWRPWPPRCSHLFLGLKEKVYPAACSLVVTVLVMAIMRALVRSAYLQTVFLPGRPEGFAPVFPPDHVLAVFVLGLGLVAYMLRLTAGAKARS